MIALYVVEMVDSVRPVSRPVKLAHVARAAGVSVPTASKALNGSGNISPATAARIKGIARQLGYQSNPTARALRVGAGDVIAAVIDRRELSADGSTPRMFWREFVDELIDCLAHQRIALLVTTPQAVSTLTTMPIGGVLIASSDPDSVCLPDSLPFGIPISCYSFDGDTSLYPVVFRHDVKSMAFAALDLLRAGGSRRPALLLPPHSARLTQAFSAAYEQWCRSQQLDPLETTMSQTEADLDEITRQTIRAGADSLVSLHPGTPQLLAALRNAGAQIPSTFQLVVQAEGVLEEVTTPTVTTLSFSARECAHICAETLVSATTAPPAGTITLPFRLTPRESTGG